jgi:hypothetical protein
MYSKPVTAEEREWTSEKRAQQEIAALVDTEVAFRPMRACIFSLVYPNPVIASGFG